MSPKRKAKNQWQDTPAAHAKYRAVRDEAQKRANETGFDYGIEANDIFHTYSCFLLPDKSHRFGHELKCEVVSSEKGNIQPGYGPWKPGEMPKWWIG